ncbi:hypothetical protein C6Q08_19440 [Burkholderia multivorans]|uniref:hypothetical protein n=1 Tax=Burkholderia multivorans TaxID=87883 RepID=UPI000CFE935F|nr:hypothetical protein [Burkholderia multivorans]PRF30921.1 hypothetical protein C6Q08_19440 [Burkholderia multivorans]
MEINSNLLTTLQNSGAAKSTATLATGDSTIAAAYASTLAQSIATQGDSVTLSGEAIMLSRLYGGSEKGIPTTPLVGSKDVGAADPVMWLKAEDRSALSDLYGYAQETGADLHYVDDIAFQLAYYRQTAGTVVSNWTTTPMYDTEGHRLTSSFSDKDVASAKIIQTNSNNTKLDKGFLNYILDQGYGQNHIMNFQFLKKFVTRGSTGDNTNANAAEFETYVVTPRSIVTASKDVELHHPEPDFICINGVFSITAKGEKNGFVLVNGQPTQQQKTDSVQVKNGHLAVNIEKPSFAKTILAMLTGTATKPSSAPHHKKVT